MAHRRATFGYLAPILINQLIEVQASPQDECSICLERVNGKKLNHKQCSLTACKQCLLSWLNENQTCPLCRREIRGNPLPEVVPTDRSLYDEIERVQAVREGRPNPSEYHVVLNGFAGIRTILEGLPLPEGRATLDFWTQVRSEERGTHVVSLFAGLEALTTQSVDDLIRRCEEYRLSDDSINCLWLALRIFGCRTFYLIQFEDYPNLGFWTPVVPKVKLLSSADELMDIIHDMDCRTEPGFLARMERQSSMTQIPIPTRFFADFLRSSLRLFPEDSQHKIAEIYDLARTEGITHWALIPLQAVDQPHNHPDFDRGIWAVPWPDRLISSGYKRYQFPGLNTNTNVSGWDPEFDESKLRDLVALYRAEHNLDEWHHAFDYFGQAPDESNGFDLGALAMALG